MQETLRTLSNRYVMEKIRRVKRPTSPEIAHSIHNKTPPTRCHHILVGGDYSVLLHLKSDVRGSLLRLYCHCYQVTYNPLEEFSRKILSIQKSLF